MIRCVSVRPCPIVLACVLTVLESGIALAQAPGDPYSRLLAPLVPRSLGPANMGGRVVDLAVVEQSPSTMYVATASGRLWKTVNNGTTWIPVFDEQNTLSLGAVALAPSNPNIIYVGTGEANPRNSVSWGDGVYRSEDGGKTWRHVGLRDSAHIGRIVVHPRNPDVAYVAALGRLWGPNRERGLFRTEDGGKTWAACKFIDEDTGFIDVVMDPGEPQTLYAAAYSVRRDAFSGGNPVVMWGPGGGLYRSEDGGASWMRLSKGLPQCPLGRCGLAVSRADPRIVYAVVQTDKTTATVQGQPAGASGDPDTGGIFRSEDRGRSWRKVNDLCPRPFYYGQIRVDPVNDRRVYVLGISFHVSVDGGKTFRALLGRNIHGDHHALWLNPHDPRHLVLGNDGGLYLSYDRAATWEHVNNLPLGQFYAVGVDQRKPYWVYGGLQDNGSWGGPSATRSLAGLTNADWTKVLTGDGYYCQVDPTDPDIVYAESQYGRPRRLHRRTGASVDIQPRAPKGQPAYRFNWSAPLLLSPHDSRTLYFGGNHVFRSTNRGDKWEVISPDLSRGQPGPSRHTGHTITALAESPRRPGLLYAGTDDGRFHVRRDGQWFDLTDTVPGVPAERWVTRLECSHHEEGTAYLALDRHRHEDRRPYLFRTTDYGANWTPLASGLPTEGHVHVIRESSRNRALLFAGTEFGLFLSLDGGARWQRIRNGLPAVPVHDLVIHPRDRELVIATHGRGLYILDIAPLEGLTAEALAADVYLCAVKPATAYRLHGIRPVNGVKAFTAANPRAEAAIYYHLRAAAPGPVKVTITNATGEVMAELAGAGQPGLHRLAWQLAVELPEKTTSRAGFTSRLVPAGDYTVRLEVGGRALTRPMRVESEED